MKKLLLALCLATVQTVSAQTADQHIGTLINESNWFELKRTMDETPRDSVSPLLYQMGTALTAHYFNRPDSACTAIGILLNEYQPELGPQNAVNMATLLATDLTRSNRYLEAAALMQSLAGQLQAQGVDTATTTPILQAADLYTAYARVAPFCRPLHSAGEYHIPFSFNDDMHQGYKKQGHFLMLDARINGTSEPVVFDTGAGANIISSRLAEACGLRLTDITLGMQGIGRQQGRVALADTLRIGPMAWQNVPFLIVDTRTGDAEADSIGDLLQPVIGLPIILSMKEVQFDFEHHELLIPATPTPNPLAGSNLLRTDSEGLRVESRDDEGHPMYMHLDTGSYGSDLTARWYAAHRIQVEAQGQPDSLRMAGIGGVSKQKTYRMPRITYRIGQGQAALDDVHVSTGLDLHTGQSVGNLFGISDIDGIIGLGLLERFRRVTLNLEEMYINAE